MGAVAVVERLRALPPKRQLILIVSVAALVCALLASIWFAFLRTSYLPLFTNLDAADASVIVAELDRKKVPYRLSDGGATILVAEDRIDATRLNVLTQDLPLKGTVGFELFNKSDMGLTDFAQKINYQRALQGELARTIMTLDGVESARVHLSMGEDRIFRDDRVLPKASVTIRMKRGLHLLPQAAQGVQRLIAAAVPKLDVANVVVLDEVGQVVAAPLQVPSASPNQESNAALASAGTNAPSADSIAPVGSAGMPALATHIAYPIGSGSSTEGAVPARTPQQPAGRPRRRVTLAALAADEDPDWLLEGGLTISLVMLMLIGFLALVRRARGPRRLSDRQRLAFAARLRAAMQEGDHAAPQL